MFCKEVLVIFYLIENVLTIFATNGIPFRLLGRKYYILMSYCEKYRYDYL